MKTFSETIIEDLSFKPNSRSLIFESVEIEGLTDEEVKIQEQLYNKLMEHLKENPDLNELDEGVLGKIVGGITGFVVGPWLTKAICKALNIEKGILADLFTSRLFTAALGSAIGSR